MQLNTDELIKIKGGAFGLRAAILTGIAGLITILIGVIDGYANPTKCNNS